MQAEPASARAVEGSAEALHMQDQLASGQHCHGLVAQQPCVSGMSPTGMTLHRHRR
jgi:hypothetical protein